MDLIRGFSTWCNYYCDTMSWRSISCILVDQKYHFEPRTIVQTWKFIIFDELWTIFGPPVDVSRRRRCRSQKWQNPHLKQAQEHLTKITEIAQSIYIISTWQSLSNHNKFTKMPKSLSITSTRASQKDHKNDTKMAQTLYITSTWQSLSNHCKITIKSQKCQNPYP